MIIKSKKYLFSLLAIFSVVSLGSIEAHAGTKSSYPVTVTTTYIRGSFGSARNSADTSQTIHIGDQTTSITIWARDAVGTVKSCSTNNPASMAALRGASSNSYLYTNYSAGVCNSLYVYKGSLFEPKNP